MKGTWQTTDGGLTVPLAIGAAILAVAVAGPVAAAVTAVAQALVITIAVLGALALAGVAAFVVYRLCRGRQNTPLVVHRVTPVTRPTAESLPAPRRSTAALPAPQAPAEIHLHLHGVTAEDIAAIIERRNE